VELLNEGGDYGSIIQRSTETSSKGQGHRIDWLNIKLSKVCVRTSLYVPPEMHTEKRVWERYKGDIKDSRIF